LAITLDDMIAEVRRELAMRRNVYPQRQRNAGLALRNQIARQYDVMEAILNHLEEERDHGRTVERSG
jgi:hypothetical protein